MELFQKPYKPNLTNEAFKPWHLRHTGSVLFQDPPAPKTIEQLTAELAEQTRVTGEYKTDMHKFKQQNDELTAKLKKLEEDEKKRSEEGMVNGKQFEQLAEQRRLELEAIKADRDKLNKGLVLREMNHAVLTEALAQGLEPSVKDIVMTLPKDGVLPEIAYGQDGSFNVNVKGVKEFVAALKVSKPVLFKVQTPGVSDLNASAGQVPPVNQQVEQVSAEQLAAWRESTKPEEKALYEKHMGAILNNIK